MVDSVRIYVWDRLVRLSHLVFIIGVPSAYLSYELGYMTWHMWNGYVVLFTLLLRILWGFGGSPYARFSQFVVAPKAVWHYIKTWPVQPVPRGHNPLGGYAVLALLLALASQTLSGLFSSDDVMTAGPLAEYVSSDISEALTEWHEINFFFILLPMLAVHIAAVWAYHHYKKANLIGPMLTGYKDKN